MRRTLLALALATPALLAAPDPARADVETRVRATGTLVVTWQGDPARGCAERGVCDVRGSVTLSFRDRLDEGWIVSGGTDETDELVLTASAPIVRVARGPAGDPAGVCVDGPGTEVQLALEVDPDRPRRLGFDADGYGIPIDAGRCAGPRLADLLGALPSAPRPPRRGDARVDLRGTRTFAGGAFTGTVRSTVVVERRTRRVPPEVPPEDGSWSPFPEGRARAPRPPEPRRFDLLRATYVAEGLAGSITADLAAPAGPSCRLLDACGLDGRVTLAALPARAPAAVVHVVAVRRRPPGVGRLTPARALALAGRGRLRTTVWRTYEEPLHEPRGRAVADVRHGDARCADEREVALPELEPSLGRGTVRFALGGPSFAPAPDDVLRTRCPGPGRSELVGPSGAVAAGDLPLRRLAAARTTVRLVAPAARRGPLPARLGGALTFSLRRTSARVRRVSARDVAEAGL